MAPSSLSLSVCLRSRQLLSPHPPETSRASNKSPPSLCLPQGPHRRWQSHHRVQQRNSSAEPLPARVCSPSSVSCSSLFSSLAPCWWRHGATGRRLRAPSSSRPHLSPPRSQAVSAPPPGGKRVGVTSFSRGHSQLEGRGLAGTVGWSRQVAWPPGRARVPVGLGSHSSSRRTALLAVWSRQVPRSVAPSEGERERERGDCSASGPVCSSVQMTALESVQGECCPAPGSLGSQQHRLEHVTPSRSRADSARWKTPG